MSAADILKALSCGKSGCECNAAVRAGKGKVHCPGHADGGPSLSVNVKGGKVLLKDFGGCSQQAVIDALRERGLWAPAPAKQRAEHMPAGPPVTSDTLADPSVKGVTLLHLAEAKGLSVDFLRGLGVADVHYQGQKAVRIEYRGVTGAVTAARYRMSLDGDCFRWKSGDKVHLYGLWRLDITKRAGRTLLVEGESDSWSGWAAGLPVFGVPGKSTSWRSEWAGYLKGLTVYLWQEPGAEDFSRRVAQDIPDLQMMVAPDGVKDLADAHKLGRDLVPFIEGLKASAFPARQLLDADKQLRLDDLREQALSVLASEDPVALVKAAIPALSYGGDATAVEITYLACTSQLLAHRRGAMPVHLLLLATSSFGKSYVLGTALAMLPPEAYYVIDAGSPRVLIYDDADLQHRVVIFGEVDSLPSGEHNPAASAIRNLLQDGYLHYKVTVRDPETGGFTVAA